MVVMHKYLFFKNLSLAATIAVLSAATLVGCNSAPDENVLSDYRVDGAVIQGLDSDTTLVVVALDRDDRTRAGASVKYGGISLGFNQLASPLDSTYSLAVASGTFFAGTDVELVVRDGSTSVDSNAYDVADTFSIISRTPAIDTLTPPWSVSLDWGGASNANAYVVAAVKASEAFTGEGYSAYLFNQTTAGTVPPDAFLLPVSSEPDTGKYYFYIYAISGAPDSVLTADLLPVPLPQQLDDNITTRRARGRFGSIMVSLRDSMYVYVIR